MNRPTFALFVLLSTLAARAQTFPPAVDVTWVVKSTPVTITASGVGTVEGIFADPCIKPGVDLALPSGVITFWRNGNRAEAIQFPATSLTRIEASAKLKSQGGNQQALPAVVFIPFRSRPPIISGTGVSTDPNAPNFFRLNQVVPNAATNSANPDPVPTNALTDAHLARPLADAFTLQEMDNTLSSGWYQLFAGNGQAQGLSVERSVSLRLDFPGAAAAALLPAVEVNWIAKSEPVVIEVKGKGTLKGIFADPCVKPGVLPSILPGGQITFRLAPEYRLAEIFPATDLLRIQASAKLTTTGNGSQQTQPAVFFLPVNTVSGSVIISGDGQRQGVLNTFRVCQGVPAQFSGRLRDQPDPFLPDPVPWNALTTDHVAVNLTDGSEDANISDICLSGWYQLFAVEPQGLVMARTVNIDIRLASPPNPPTGSRSPVIPFLRNLPVAIVSQRLAALGFAPVFIGSGNPPPRRDCAFCADWQDPPPDTKAPHGTRVTVAIHPDWIDPGAVPALIGLTRMDAEAALAAAGLEAKAEDGVPADDPSWVGQVHSQEPEAGASPPASKVVLIRVFQGKVAPTDEKPSGGANPFLAGVWTGRWEQVVNSRLETEGRISFRLINGELWPSNLADELNPEELPQIASMVVRKFNETDGRPTVRFLVSLTGLPPEDNPSGTPGGGTNTGPGGSGEADRVWWEYIYWLHGRELLHTKYEHRINAGQRGSEKINTFNGTLAP